MINKDFFAALDALESEKGISKEYFLDALQSALATAYKRNFNEVRPVEVVLDEVDGVLIGGASLKAEDYIAIAQSR